MENNVGKISIAKNGFGFISAEGLEEDLFVPKVFVNGALDQDSVSFETYMNPKKEVLEAKVSSIIERNTKFIVCRTKKRGKFMDFLPLNRKINNFIRTVNWRDFDLKEDYFYKLKILRVDEKGFLICVISREIGDISSRGFDISAILEEYGARTKFHYSVINEASKVHQKVDQKDFSNRNDLRNLFTFTIDNDDSKDRDDAISIIKEGQNYRLFVHIADVSYYVQEDTKIDKEAFKRGCSIYVADRVVPMLPVALSNGICSLNANVDRFAMTSEMLINQAGECIEFDIYPSIIHSDYQMTYTDCNSMLAGNDKVIDKYFDLYPDLISIRNLKDILFKKRQKNGSLEFEIKEGRIILDESGQAIDIQIRKMGESNLIIEELMLIANQSVAKFMKDQKLPSIYRVHEFPSEQKQQDLVTTLAKLGYKMNYDDEKQYLFELQRIISNVKPEDQLVVSLMMLRSLEKARYDGEKTTHFALAAKYYTHFTSPIRRYPDLLLHRLIREFIFKGNDSAKNIEKYEEIIAKAAIENSASERLAIDSERGVNDVKKAELMKSKVGQQFPGVIVAILRFGMFVELENTVEGLVAYDSFLSEEFEYNDDLKVAVGKKTKRVFKLGQKVDIEVVSADIFEAKIDFKIIENIDASNS